MSSPVARTGQHPRLRPGWKILPTRIGYNSNINWAHPFRYGNNNACFMLVQPHFYHVWCVKQLGWRSHTFFLSNLALGAMPKQQQQQQQPGNIHGFVLDGKSYRQGWVTAQTPTVPAVSFVTITTLFLRTCNLTTIACGRWSLVLILSNWLLGAMPKQQL